MIDPRTTEVASQRRCEIYLLCKISPNPQENIHDETF